MATEAGSASGAASAAAGAGAELEGWEMSADEVRTAVQADEALKKVFGGKAVVNMFEMTKLVSKHLS